MNLAPLFRHLGESRGLARTSVSNRDVSATHKR